MTKTKNDWVSGNKDKNMCLPSMCEWTGKLYGVTRPIYYSSGRKDQRKHHLLIKPSSIDRWREVLMHNGVIYMVQLLAHLTYNHWMSSKCEIKGSSCFLKDAWQVWDQTLIKGSSCFLKDVWQVWDQTLIKGSSCFLKDVWQVWNQTLIKCSSCFLNGWDSNFEVYIFKSCDKWNIYLALNNMYLVSTWNL